MAWLKILLYYYIVEVKCTLHLQLLLRIVHPSISTVARSDKAHTKFKAQNIKETASLEMQQIEGKNAFHFPFFRFCDATGI